MKDPPYRMYVLYAAFLFWPSIYTDTDFFFKILYSFENIDPDLSIQTYITCRHTLIEHFCMLEILGKLFKLLFQKLDLPVPYWYTQNE